MSDTKYNFPHYSWYIDDKNKGGKGGKGGTKGDKGGKGKKKKGDKEDSLPKILPVSCIYSHLRG